MNNFNDFSGKVAFITGGGSGIGRATALAFARARANVTAADVSEEGGRETARLIEQEGGRALAVHCDVTRSDDVKAALEKTAQPSDDSTSHSIMPESSRKNPLRLRTTMRTSGIGLWTLIFEASFSA